MTDRGALFDNMPDLKWTDSDEDSTECQVAGYPSWPRDRWYVESGDYTDVVCNFHLSAFLFDHMALTDAYLSPVQLTPIEPRPSRIVAKMVAQTLRNAWIEHE